MVGDRFDPAHRSYIPERVGKDRCFLHALRNSLVFLDQFAFNLRIKHYDLDCWR